MKKYLNSIVLLVFVLFSYQNISFAGENNNLFSEEFKQYEKINKEQISDLQEIFSKKINIFIAQKDQEKQNALNNAEQEKNNALAQRDQQHQEEIESLKAEQLIKEQKLRKILNDKAIEDNMKTSLLQDQYKRLIETLNNKIKELEEDNLFFKEAYAKQALDCDKLLGENEELLPKAEAYDEIVRRNEEVEEESEIEINENDLPEYLKQLEKECLEFEEISEESKKNKIYKL